MIKTNNTNRRANQKLSLKEREREQVHRKDRSEKLGPAPEPVLFLARLLPRNRKA